MASITGQEVREELLKWGLLRLLGTATAGATTYITDTVRLQSGALSSTSFEDCWVRITSGSGDGEISKVDYLDQDLGRLYLTPAVTAIVAGVTYEIIRAGIRPDDLRHEWGWQVPSGARDRTRPSGDPRRQTGEREVSHSRSLLSGFAL